MYTINVRTTCPKESDKYAKCYRTQSTGGWSACIKGKPTQPYCNVLANCFSGETEYITQEGLKDFYSTVGTVQMVLNEKGKFTPAEIKDFGEQQLYKVTFGNNNVVYATANHRWVVDHITYNGSKSYITRKIKTTLELTKKDNIPYNYYKGNDLLDKNGIIHGLVYGDGSKNKNCNTYRLQLFGNKQELKKYLPEHITSDYNLKEVPSIYENEEYLRGFLAGVIATDGTITHDTFKISSTKKTDLLQIANICYKIGVAIGGVYEEARDIELGKYRYENHKIYYLTLKRKHIDNLLLKSSDKLKLKVKYRDIKYTHITSIETTDRYETVYCAVEPETHTITLAGNILTGQCVGFASARFNEIYDELTGKTGNKYQLICNAENFIEHAKRMGLETGTTPRPGAICVLQKGATLKSADGAGHVFICEYPLDLNPANYKIYTSESGYNSSAFWNAVRSNENGRYGAGASYSFREFIYNPAVNYYKPEIVGRDTNVNQIRTVKAMNVRLGIETNTESIAYVPVGTIFNYYATKNGKSSVWYAVSKDLTQWIAGVSLSGDKKYVEVLPASQPAPKPVQKFKIGDKVTVNGKIYVSSNAPKAAGVLRNKKTTITRYSKTGKHPYNFTGDIGWADESSITKR